MPQYKPIVRKSPGWRNHSAATLGVSVLSPNWQGEKFASILGFCAENFKLIRIDVTDALYRHNFVAEGMPPIQALAKANEAGAEWLERNREIIAQCPVPTEIVRWSKWYSHTDFNNTLMAFQALHDMDPILREAVNHDATEFCRRRAQEPTLARLENSCILLLEELAVSTLQARALPSVKIYPGNQLESQRVVRCGLVGGAPAGLELEQFARIKFEKKAAQNPKLSLKTRQCNCGQISRLSK